MADESAGIPVRNPVRSPLAAFREEAGRGRVATGSGSAFPPRFSDASGRLEAGAGAVAGTVYSATRVERRGNPCTLALIDLPGGGRVLAQVLADDAAALIGRAVRLLGNREPFPTFAPDDQA